MKCPKCGQEEFVEKLGGYVCKNCRYFITKENE